MKRILIIAGLAIVAAGCYNDKADKLYPAPATNTCDTTSISYAKDIAPIISASCAISGCHDASGGAINGFDFTTYAGLKDVANTATLINDINFTPTSGNHSMPQGGSKLPSCEINKITRWVNEGAPNN